MLLLLGRRATERVKSALLLRRMGARSKGIESALRLVMCLLLRIAERVESSGVALGRRGGSERVEVVSSGAVSRCSRCTVSESVK